MVTVIEEKGLLVGSVGFTQGRKKIKSRELEVSRQIEEVPLRSVIKLQVFHLVPDGMEHEQ